jgi:hypothetical protein
MTERQQGSEVVRQNYLMMPPLGAALIIYQTSSQKYGLIRGKSNKDKTPALQETAGCNAS